MKTIVTTAPPDLNTPDAISPEMLQIAESYLFTNSIIETAKELDVPQNVVAEYLDKREVRTYIDSVYMETGYRNRHTLGDALDSVINAKLEEMEEAEVTSSKDIADLLSLAQKFRKDELELQIKLIKAQAELSKVVQGNTINIQDNSIEGSNYGSLISKLLESKP